MKKQLLLSTGIFISGLLCAQVAGKATKIPLHLANKAVLSTKRIDDKIINSSLPFQTTVQINNAKRTTSLTENVLGSTYYDFQSNSSVGDRIVLNADGSIAACWTFEGAADGGTYANRGTGYAYYNGSAWTSPPATRVENARVGWGNIVNTRSGKELILSHNGTAELSHMASRPSKGTGAWSNSTSFITNVPGGNWWPRMVSSSPTGGDTLYSISISYPGSPYNGLDAALLFSRSTNAGATWDIQNQQPTGFTSDNYLGFGGDAYAITAKGSTVAIVAGDSDSDIGLAKSTDGGVTWTYKTIYKFPIPLWDYTTTISDVDGDNVPDTISSNDGVFAIALDNNGKAYVSYGAYRLLHDDPSTGYSYFPYTDGLYLWDESMPQNAGGVIVAGMEDLGEQGTIYFPTPSADMLPFGSFYSSLTSFSNMAFDANNVMYLTYSSVVDSLLAFTDDPKLVRHVYVMKSLDFGANWSVPKDIVPSFAVAYEGMYASLAKTVDANIHLIYQRDFYPGYSVPPATGTDPDAENIDSPSDIIYVKLPVSEISNPIPTAIKAESSVVSKLNFYPNPTSTNGTIEVVLNENSKMDISILNSVGQTVYSTMLSGNSGINRVELNLNNLSSGLYFYQVKLEGSKAITKKFAIEK
ncbi:MAG: T9SS type A sorting domain-containing protein [Bacteroidota bacterium]